MRFFVTHGHIQHQRKGASHPIAGSEHCYFIVIAAWSAILLAQQRHEIAAREL
jgi:hypothetical protein